jgi:simple sugar transport system permease protein
MATQGPAVTEGTGTGTATPAGSERLRSVSLTQRILGRPASGAAIIAIFLWILFAVIAGSGGFLSFAGTLSYLDVAAQVGILGTSVALLMIGGEYDLSIGSLVGVAGIIIGIGVTTYGLPVWLMILIAIVVTTGLGAVNGIIVVRTGLPSFIVTLATLFILRGLTIAVTAMITNITYIPIEHVVVANDPIAWLFNWSGGERGEFKVSILWWIAIVAVGAYVLGKTKFGNWIAGAGGSASAARNLGVPVARVKIILFASTGFSAAILATITSMTFFSADVLRGRGVELNAITTAVIGGTLLSGGYGSVVGTAIGSLALGMAQIGLFFGNINSDWYAAAIGTLLLVAVVLNNWIRRRFAGIR